MSVAPARTAVVTGGTRGIGLAIARQLLDVDYRVVALARSEPAELPDGLELEICDLTDETAVQATFADLGRIDVLVNNAGVSSSSPLHRTSTQDWNHNLAVNATAVFWCCRAVLPAMRQADRGRIITIASTAALQGTPYVAAYAASKHAAIGLMRVLATEVEGTGVAVTTICPTFVDTDMTRTTVAGIASATGSSPDEARRRLVATTPHGRIISATEVADAVSGVLDGGLNGEEILLDGRQAPT